MIILDTNVVSELLKPRPDEAVVAWVSQRTELILTAITVAEIEAGIHSLPAGKRKDELASGFRDAISPFPIATFDDVAAREYGRIVAIRKAAGAPIAPLDAQIAAIAAAHGAAVATRNVKDFAHLELDIINPWQPETRVP